MNPETDKTRSIIKVDFTINTWYVLINNIIYRLSRFFKILVVLGLLIDSRCCACVCVGIRKLQKLQKNDNEIIKVIIKWIIIVTYLQVIFHFASTGRLSVFLM